MPLARLAPQYGLSDVGLKKKLKKLKIPTPPRGYWAKLAAGQKIKPLPLPKIVAEEELIRLFQVDTPSTKEKKKYFKYDTPIQVPSGLRNPHPLIKKVKAVLKASTLNESGILTTDSTNCLDIRVSKQSLNRALLIMNIFIKVIEQLGHEVSVITGCTIVQIHEKQIGIGIEEVLEPYQREPRDEDFEGYYQFHHHYTYTCYRPTGMLQLKRCVGRSIQSNWRDKDQSKLEDQLNSFINSLFRVAGVEEL